MAKKQKLTAEGKRWKQKYTRLNDLTQKSHLRNLEKKVKQLEMKLKDSQKTVHNLNTIIEEFEKNV